MFLFWIVLLLGCVADPPAFSSVRLSATPPEAPSLGILSRRSGSVVPLPPGMSSGRPSFAFFFLFFNSGSDLQPSGLVFLLRAVVSPLIRVMYPSSF